MEYYAVYDTQLDGFKARESYKSYDHAMQGAIDRVYNYHEDYLEGVETFETYRIKNDLTTDILFIESFDYEVRKVNEDTHNIINNGEIGMCTTVEGV